MYLISLLKLVADSVGLSSIWYGLGITSVDFHTSLHQFLRNFQGSIYLTYLIRLQWNISLQPVWDSTLKGLQLGFYTAMLYQINMSRGIKNL